MTTLPIPEQLEETALVQFQCKKIPPANALSYRAELWNVDKWMQIVTMRIVIKGDLCIIYLLDNLSGELFAECPVPNPDDAPLSSVVDAVIDSSRYFALRLENPKTKQHAMIGIGFEQRHEASDFVAALTEYVQRMRRQKKAEKMHDEYVKKNSGELAGTISNLSLKPGQNLKIDLKVCKNKDDNEESLSSLKFAANHHGGNIKLYKEKTEEEWGDFVS